MDSRIERSWRRASEYFAAHQLDAARACVESILAERPDHPMANSMFASICLNAGRPRLASQHAIHASLHARDLACADKVKISWMLMTTGNSGLALPLLRSIKLGDPDALNSLWEMARQLSLLDCHTEGLACLAVLDGLGARGAQLSHLRGSLHSYAGNTDHAIASFEQAIALAPDYALAHWSLSQAAPPDGRAARVDRLRKLLGRGVISVDDQALLYYALFRELDEMDDTGPAWDALCRGAMARGSVTSYDRAVENRIFDLLVADDSPLPVAAGQLSEAGSTPIFIVGMPRTGTTLIERILGNHPDVRICGELTDLTQQHQWVLDSTWPGMFDEASARRVPQTDTTLLGRRYREATAWRSAGKPWFSDKNPGNFQLCGLILRALPEARIIHISREPMDACFSNFKLLFAPGAYPYSYSFAGLANHHRNYRRLMQHWDRVAPGAILDVSYESLVTGPEAQAARILDHCGLSRQIGITEVQANAAAVSTASKHQVRQAIHRRNIGSWRRFASQLAPLEQLLSP